MAVAPLPPAMVVYILHLKPEIPGSKLAFRTKGTDLDAVHPSASSIVPQRPSLFTGRPDDQVTRASYVPVERACSSVGRYCHRFQRGPSYRPDAE